MELESTLIFDTPARKYLVSITSKVEFIILIKSTSLWVILKVFSIITLESIIVALPFTI